MLKVLKFVRSRVIYWQLRAELAIWAWRWKRWLNETLMMPPDEAMKRITATRWKLRNYPDCEMSRAYERSLKLLEKFVTEAREDF